MFKKSKLGRLSCAVTLGLAAQLAWGLEGVAPAGPIGGSDIRSALLPPPGLYGGPVGVNVDIGNVHAQDGTLPASGSQRIGGLGLLYVYEDRLAGGTLGSSLFAGYSEVCFGIKGSSKSCSRGALDTYADLLMWSYFIPASRAIGRQGGKVPIPYGLAVQLGFGVSFPTGKYDKNSPVNVGANFYDFAPNVALTYTVPSLFGPYLGQATEFSARTFYHYYTENPDTHYQTGNLLSIDFAATQRWNDWQFGIAGTAYKQVADDERDGVKVAPDGNRASYVGVGPLISHDFMAGGRLWNIGFKAMIGVEQENKTSADAYVLKLGTKW